MDGLTRRPSGVYVARISVPARLRGVIGKTELTASTGVRDLKIARIVSGGMMAAWRRRFLELENLTLGLDLDVLRVVNGSPILAGATGHLRLSEAAVASGLGETTILKHAAEGRLNLLHWAAGLTGHFIDLAELDENFDPCTVNDVEYVLPSPSRMPREALEMSFSGVLQLSPPETPAAMLLAGREVSTRFFLDPGSPGHGFILDEPITLNRFDIFVVSAQVEALRRRVAGLVTPDQFSAAQDKKQSAQPTAEQAVRSRPIQDSIEAFLADHAEPRGDEQTQRIRSACLLFLELMGQDLCGKDLDREVMRRFRDKELPRVPANENKVRLIHKTKSISESIRAVEGTDWPRMSAEQQVKRLVWIAGWMDWLGNEGWTEKGLLAGISGRGEAGAASAKRRQTRKDQDRRDSFTEDELNLIFSASWFRDGQGELSKSGTYRTWMPYRTWLPLIGLLTGARIGEIAQLSLSDLWQNEAGVWLFDITDGSEQEDGAEPAKKRLKTVNARRQIPMHPKLIELGLIQWRDLLRDQGYTRLFPELKFDKTKGYSKAATRWFSEYLGKLGIPRDLRKVFHSFRHNMTTRLLNDLEVPLPLAKQILGHERGDSVTINTYRKDVIANGLTSKLAMAISSIDYGCLDRLGKFDQSAGLKAVKDALARKNGGRGSAQD